MSATKRPTSLIFFLWPATLVAAFFIGRISMTTDPAAGRELFPPPVAAERTPPPMEGDRKVEAPALQEAEMISEDVIDPLLKIRSAIAEADSLKQIAMLTDAFSHLTKDNILEGMALLESIDDVRIRQQMRGLLLNTWGKLDGPAAMEYVMSQDPQDGGGFRGPGGRSRGGFDRGGSNLRDTMTVMSGWGEVDPQAAVAFANENDDGGRNTMLMAALQGWAENDVEGAINYAMDNPNQISGDQRGGRGGGMENFLINRYVRENSQAATQWALSQSDPEKRSDAVVSVASSLANENPREAVTWAESISDPDLRSEAIRGAASGWVREDPVAAMDWALSLEDTSSATQASETALNTWARQDPYNASDYVINMEAGANKDQAAATLTRSLVREDPEMALLWAESISDPDLQVETLAPIAQSWMQRNPEQATKWLQSSSLSEETKRALLAPQNP